jgi:hypothetical protein
MIDVPVHLRVRNVLIGFNVPTKVSATIGRYGSDALHKEILGNTTQWISDVVSGKYDVISLGVKGIGPTQYRKLVEALRNIPPAQPSPASKAEATVKPNGVSYSIHVDNANYAAALMRVASVMADRMVGTDEAEALAYILDCFMLESNWFADPDAYSNLISATEQFGNYLRSE